MNQIYNYDCETVNQMLAEADAVEAAIRDSVRDALRKHKQLGLAVVTWRDGRVVWIPCDQIPIETAGPPAHL